jgi:hypothetical protein
MLYLSDIIRALKPRRMGWAKHITRMREKRNAYRGLVVMAERELTFKN